MKRPIARDEDFGARFSGSPAPRVDLSTLDENALDLAALEAALPPVPPKKKAKTKMRPPPRTGPAVPLNMPSADLRGGLSTMQGGMPAMDMPPPAPEPDLPEETFDQPSMIAKLLSPSLAIEEEGRRRGLPMDNQSLARGQRGYSGGMISIPPESVAAESGLTDDQRTARTRQNFFNLAPFALGGLEALGPKLGAIEAGAARALGRAPLNPEVITPKPPRIAGRLGGPVIDTTAALEPEVIMPAGPKTAITKVSPVVDGRPAAGALPQPFRARPPVVGEPPAAPPPMSSTLADPEGFAASNLPPVPLGTDSEAGFGTMRPPPHPGRASIIRNETLTPPAAPPLRPPSPSTLNQRPPNFSPAAMPEEPSMMSTFNPDGMMDDIQQQFGFGPYEPEPTFVRPRPPTAAPAAQPGIAPAQNANNAIAEWLAQDLNRMPDSQRKLALLALLGGVGAGAAGLIAGPGDQGGGGPVAEPMPRPPQPRARQFTTTATGGYVPTR